MAGSAIIVCNSVYVRRQWRNDLLSPIDKGVLHPADRVGRGNETCQGCHVPPTLIPHSLGGRADCLVCHETGVGGAPQVPADHAGRTNDLCQNCHVTE